EFPKRHEFGYELARPGGDLGNLMDALNHAKDAQAADRDALVQFKAATDLAAQPGLRGHFPLTHGTLAHLLPATRPLQAAHAAYRDALVLQQKLVNDFPKVAGFQNQLAATLGNLAFVYHQRREFAAAVQMIQKARPHNLAALEASPKDPTYRKVYHNALKTQAASYSGLADHAGLAAAAEELVGF